MEQIFLQYGAIGAILLWFIYRDSKTSKEAVEAQNNMARVLNNNNKVSLMLVETVSNCSGNLTNTQNKLRNEELGRLKNEVWNDPINTLAAVK